MGAADLRLQHGVIRAAAQHLMDVAQAERGYRAAAPGLLRDLDRIIADHIAEEGPYPYAGMPGDAEPLSVLTVAWTDYLATWDTARIAGNWSGFAAATQAILPRMLTRIDHEDACLRRDEA